MTKMHFKELFAYDQWANERIAVVMAGCKDLPQKAQDLYDHIMWAQDIWLGRIRNHFLVRQSRYTEETFESWEAFFNGIADESMQEEVKYHNSKNILFSSRLQDILHHIVNHGTYHRGQIVSLVKKAGGDLVATDMIVFSRKKEQ